MPGVMMRMRYGSPPRVRGKLPELSWHFSYARLTPACAGKTPSAPPTYPESPAHPRVCGENVKTVWDWVSSLGSPPRVRGKL